jgi:flagellar M-ring protein FliF
MEWLSQGLPRFAHFLRSLSPAARMGSLLLLFLLAVSLAGLLRTSGAPQSVEIFGQRTLSDREIARLESAFAKAGLNDWEVLGNRIRVPRAQRHAYLAAADSENSLPADFDSVLEETLKNSTPFEPKELRDMKRHFALQRELAGIIDALDGIERATVKVNEERVGPFSREIRRTALVAARASSGDYLTAAQVDAIRRTIASGTATPPENIVVTDLRGVAHAGYAPAGSVSPYEPLFSAERKKYEEYYQEKISQSLSMIPGVVVGVRVELTSDERSTTLVPGLDPSLPLAASRSPARTELAGPAPVEVETPPSAGGSTGLSTTASRQDTGVKSPADHTVTEYEDVRDTHASLLAIGSTEVRTPPPNSRGIARRDTRRADLGFAGEPSEGARVTATVQIPRSYFRKSWQQQADRLPDEDTETYAVRLQQWEQEETERIQEAVRNLLPQRSDDGRLHSQVLVQAFTDGVSANGVQVSLGRQAFDWFVEHRAAWISLACGLMGLVVVPWVLLLVRSAFRPEEALSSTETSLDDFPYGSRTAPSIVSDEHPWDEISAGDDAELKDRLLQLVRTEPDIAAAVLSKWIEDAA